MFSRFRATPNEAFPEQNVWIFPARHAQCDIWVFPHNLTSPLPFPSSMLKVSIITKEKPCEVVGVSFCSKSPRLEYPPPPVHHHPRMEGNIGQKCDWIVPYYFVFGDAMNLPVRYYVVPGRMLYRNSDGIISYLVTQLILRHAIISYPMMICRTQ